MWHGIHTCSCTCTVWPLHFGQLVQGSPSGGKSGPLHPREWKQDQVEVSGLGLVNFHSPVVENSQDLLQSTLLHIQSAPSFGAQVNLLSYLNKNVDVSEPFLTQYIWLGTVAVKSARVTGRFHSWCDWVITYSCWDGQFHHSQWPVWVRV